ncbi:MAG: helix-turn-helix domain-containing protein [Verrucomicrobiota bacterium]
MQYTQLFRRLREQKGLSHEALARMARCHRNTVINVECGRQVRFKTLAGLMRKMGYASDSPEMASLALLWLEAVSGINLADPANLAPVRQRIAVYGRSAAQAAQHLAETVRRARLDERDIRLLEFAAQRPEVLAILGSLRDLLAGSGADSRAELKVAEDR